MEIIMGDKFEHILSRLEGLKKMGKESYMAYCPAHPNTKTQALAIKQTFDGVILIKCFAGCDVHSISTALGIELSDLFPHLDQRYIKPLKRPFEAVTVLKGIAPELTIIQIIAGDLHRDKCIDEHSWQRLQLAIDRVRLGIQAGVML